MFIKTMKHNENKGPVFASTEDTQHLECFISHIMDGSKKAPQNWGPASQVMETDFSTAMKDGDLPLEGESVVCVLCDMY